MPLLTLLGRWLDRGATGLFGVAGAGGGSQTSAFLDAYRQNLAGRVDELGRIVAGFEARADRAGLPLDAYVTAFTGNGSAVIRWEGEAMAATIERYRALADTLSAIDRSTPLTEPFVALGGLDPRTAADAWAAFTPALPLDVAGMGYTLAGAIVLMALFQLLILPVRAGAAAARSPTGKPSPKP